MNDRASAVTLAAIGDIAEVRPGLSTGERLEHKDGATWQVILSRHLVPGQPYRFTDADRFTIDPERDAARYRVHVGDVLFMSRGTRNVASWIKSIPEDSVAPVSLYPASRTSRRTGLPDVVAQSPVAQRTIADIRTGAGTPIVQRKSFAELQLPLPLAEQRIIAQLGQAMTQERVVLEQLAAATERLHLLTSDHIARDLLARVEPTMTSNEVSRVDQQEINDILWRACDTFRGRSIRRSTRTTCGDALPQVRERQLGRQARELAKYGVTRCG